MLTVFVDNIVLCILSYSTTLVLKYPAQDIGLSALYLVLLHKGIKPILTHGHTKGTASNMQANTSEMTAVERISNARQWFEEVFSSHIKWEILQSK